MESDTYIIMGYSYQPIKLNDFFIVPKDCIIVMKERYDSIHFMDTVINKLNNIGAPGFNAFSKIQDNNQRFSKQFGDITIYKEGQECPNYHYSFYFDEIELKSSDYFDEESQDSIISHMGLIKTPLITPIHYVDFSLDYNTDTTHRNLYIESILPTTEDISKVINIDTYPTFRKLLTEDREEDGKLLRKIRKTLSLNLTNILRIQNGISHRPGMYFNFGLNKMTLNEWNKIGRRLINSEAIKKLSFTSNNRKNFRPEIELHELISLYWESSKIYKTQAYQIGQSPKGGTRRNRKQRYTGIKRTRNNRRK